MTHGLVRFHIDGERARTLLAKGCTLDLHPRAFHAGPRAQTLLAQGFVLLDRDGEAFRVIAEASYAHHLLRWFDDASVEFGSGEGQA